MNRGQFYDSETTGLPVWNEPSNRKVQPHIVQLAAALFDLDEEKEIDCMNVIVKPDGWDIPQEMVDVHGITMERAMDEGIPEVDAVLQFFELWKKGGEGVLRIGHNETFDRRIIRIATSRYPELAEFKDPWKDLEKDRSFCTMHKSRKSCDLGKAPTLSEAYTHFCNEDLDGAHDAMVDVRGCVAVYFGLKHETEGSTESGYTGF